MDYLLSELGLRGLPRVVAAVGVANFLRVLLVGVRAEGQILSTVLSDMMDVARNLFV